jgi:hypothetical protein
MDEPIEIENKAPLFNQQGFFERNKGSLLLIFLLACLVFLTTPKSKDLDNQASQPKQEKSKLAAALGSSKKNDLSPAARRSKEEFERMQAGTKSKSSNKLSPEQQIAAQQQLIKGIQSKAQKVSEKQSQSQQPIQKENPIVSEKSKPISESKNNYDWLGADNSCEGMLGLFRARFAPFGPYSQLNDQQKHEVDKTIRFLCGNHSSCGFNFCSAKKAQPDSGKMLAKYNDRLKLKLKALESFQSKTPDSSPRPVSWKRFTLEVSHSTPKEVESKSPGKNRRGAVRGGASKSREKFLKTRERLNRASERFRSRTGTSR